MDSVPELWHGDDNNHKRIFMPDVRNCSAC